MVQGQSQQIFVSPAGSPPGNMTGGNMTGAVDITLASPVGGIGISDSTGQNYRYLK
jgi:hypothetical protein